MFNIVITWYAFDLWNRRIYFLNSANELLKHFSKQVSFAIKDLIEVYKTTRDKYSIVNTHNNRFQHT